MARTPDFQTIRSEGGLLPTDLLQRLLDPADSLPGKQPEDYHLAASERLTEVITLAWNRLRRRWSEFRELRSKLPDGEAGTGLTNEKWSLPVLREMGYGQLPFSPGPTLDGRPYAINRFLGSAPLHLIGCGLSLDRITAGQKGAAKVNPHGLVQDYLNRQQDALWGVLCNGLRLRLLRDSQALSRQSYLEIDLEAMFEGEVYSDFVLFWLTLHATRLVEQDAGKPGSCWLERWTQEAQAQGTRALGDLKAGVEKALETLGQGFTSHPRNTALREALRNGELSLTDFHAQLLRVVYRLIFLFVAEDRRLEGRSLLHAIDDSESARLARERYAAYFSTARLREMAGVIKGSRHGDLWRQLGLVMGALSGAEEWAGTRAALALPALGSFLWSPSSTPSLNPPGFGGGPSAELSNHDLLETLRHLAYTRRNRQLRPVDYRRLGAEELGGVYESLLALTPQLEGGGTDFHFKEFSGNQRKTSGSYYTPDSLVQCLLDSALEPVVAEAVHGKSAVEAEQAILALKVCDPAVGSGHFLVGAAHRLARHLSRERALIVGESAPSPLLYQKALRDVIGRCLYGVDVNPMSAELCRMGLWLEAMEPGKPLAFLDHHIRVGNSLLGATPELIIAGIPDGAYTAIEGDDKVACTALKKRNKSECKFGYGPLFVVEDSAAQSRLAMAAAEMDCIPNDNLEDIVAKRAKLASIEMSSDFRRKRQVADAWCVAFMIRKYYPPSPNDSRFATNEPIGLTQLHLLRVADDQSLPANLQNEVDQLIERFQFFHWYLAFPEVFNNGGFDCVLGNPPWEKLQSEEKNWFTSGAKYIADMTSKDRKVAIDELENENPLLASAWKYQKRFVASQNVFLKSSNRFPLTGLGKFNTYALFSELSMSLVRPSGLFGLIVPSGIATDDNTKVFFQKAIQNNSIKSLYDFENRLGIFSDIDSRMKFCLLTGRIESSTTSNPAEFVFFAHDTDDISDIRRVFHLSKNDLALLNPNTENCPIFRFKADAEITKSVYRRISILSNDSSSNNWITRSRRVINETDDSQALCIIEQYGDQRAFVYTNMIGQEYDTYLRAYEAKMMWHYDHRYSTYRSNDSNECDSTSSIEHENASFLVKPKYWMSTSYLKTFFGGNDIPKWLLSFRRITNVTNERTMIFCILPACVTGTLNPIIEIDNSIQKICCFFAEKNSIPFDYVSRQKISGTDVNIFKLKQLPSLSPHIYDQYGLNGSTWEEFIVSRVLELSYTSWDLLDFAVDCGLDCPPFRWDDLRRFLLRCELDAAYFHLYMDSDDTGEWRPARVVDGAVREETYEELVELMKHFPTPRHSVEYILETFPIVKRKEEVVFGEYRTKRVILEIYDEMAEAMRTGLPYQTKLDPPPADPRCCHPPRESAS